MTDLEKETILKWCEFPPPKKLKIGDAIYEGFTPDLALNFYFEYAIPRLQKEWGLIDLIWDYGAWDICLGALRGEGAFHLGGETGETYEKLEDAFGQLILKLVEIDKERLV